MNKIEQLKFKVDLEWKMRFERKLDRIFCNTDFLIQFNNFLSTEEGQKWIKSEQGQRFTEWQIK